jgi:hypothetical protein
VLGLVEPSSDVGQICVPPRGVFRSGLNEGNDFVYGLGGDSMQVLSGPRSVSAGNPRVEKSRPLCLMREWKRGQFACRQARRGSGGVGGVL